MMKPWRWAPMQLLRAGAAMGRGLALLLLAATSTPVAPVPWPAVTRAPSLVFAEADAGAPWAVLSKGALVLVTDVSGSWARLGEAGVVARSQLQPDDGGLRPPSGDYLWGSARTDAGVELRARPRLDAPVWEIVPQANTLAFVRDDALAGRGWLEHVAGGYVSTADIVLHRQASTLEGERAPPLPLAFAYRATTLRLEDGGVVALAKFSRFVALQVHSDRVAVEGGVLPRKDVRVAWPRDPPEGLPDGGLWAHVDLTEQTLTAWEGATPVYATLVSAGTGAPSRITPPGLFPVWLKLRHGPMHGEDYSVEEVPLIQYFYKGTALHGVTWHDHFGQPRSHGCINLSLADARWLYDWAPPRVPEGWHSVWPREKPVPSLWVWVTAAEHRPDAGR